MTYDTSLFIGQRRISLTDPTYFIADIAANHDGDLGRAKELIWKAREAGAECAKFQHFRAERIVSDVGFSDGIGNVSHQAKWKKSVFAIYDQYHTPPEWTDDLVETARCAGIDFMTTPYDLEAVDLFRDIVPAYKIGSGDITFFEEIDRIAAIPKPILLATGAATLAEVEAAVARILAVNGRLCLMQCNTNYTGDLANFRYLNLRVLQTYSARWPGLVLGLSDHAPGHTAVLGAVTLGARVVEKHFTDDTTREGPDHGFAMDLRTWAAMVTATRELEAALGDGVKRVEENERETVVIQRRAVRARRDLPAGTILTRDMLEPLRPCPAGAVGPDRLDEIIGRHLAVGRKLGQAIAWTDLASPS